MRQHERQRLYLNQADARRPFIQQHMVLRRIHSALSDTLRNQIKLLVCVSNTLPVNDGANGRVLEHPLTDLLEKPRIHPLLHRNENQTRLLLGLCKARAERHLDLCNFFG